MSDYDSEASRYDSSIWKILLPMIQKGLSTGYN